MDPFSLSAVAIVFFMSAGMLNVWVIHRRKQQVLAQWHTERMSAMEKGLPLPELPANVFGDDAPSPARSLRSGISLVLVGIVVYVAMQRGIDEDLALFGLIPCAVGVANLVYAALLWRREQAAAANT